MILKWLLLLPLLVKGWHHQEWATRSLDLLRLLRLGGGLRLHLRHRGGLDCACWSCGWWTAHPTGVLNGAVYGSTPSHHLLGRAGTKKLHVLFRILVQLKAVGLPYRPRN